MSEKSGPWNETALRSRTRLFRHGGSNKVPLQGQEDFSGMGEVSLQGPEDFSSMAGRKINSKDIILQHDATVPTQQKPSNSIVASKNMDKGKRMDVVTVGPITQKH
jgi:hypothetical protein